jgi:hypothetical protein
MRAVAEAAAVARREVLRLNRQDPDRGNHWHLARVYAGPAGAGPLCARDGDKRKARQAMGYQEFLDRGHEVKVAGARQFVGRRRQAQAVLGHFREGAGVLIHGIGNLGKSSLAARVANRMPRHQTVVVFGRYDALAILDKLLEALPAEARDTWKQTWRDETGSRLADALEAMLEEPFDRKPILLVIDDLERILDVGPAATVVKPQWRDALAAVIRAFARANTESRLLLTSRYTFTLPDGSGGDWAKRLAALQLAPMEDRQRRKQWRAAATLAGRTEAWDEDGAELIARALQAAAGNPGLQEILCRPILAGEVPAATRAVAAVEGWRASGEVPEEGNLAQEFFRRV